MIQIRKKLVWLTTTAIFIALLIAAQAAAAPLGQFVVGPLVNLILIVAVMFQGFASGLTVALLSPVFAKLLGIGPLWAIIPFVMLGNAVLIAIWYAVGKRQFANKHAVRAVALVLAAGGKFAALYVGVVHIAVPLLLHLPEPQATAVSSMFALPQLFTALIGGVLAMAVLPVIEKLRKE